MKGVLNLFNMCKKTIADIAVNVMRENNIKNISISDYLLLHEIAEKSKHTKLIEMKVNDRQKEILDALDEDNRFKKRKKSINGNKVVRIFELLDESEE